MPSETLVKDGPFLTMYYVYILESIPYSDNFYTGWTDDLEQRLLSHNSGANKHTSKFKPWKIVWVGGFSDQKKAIAFEKYLKTASGIAFRKKRLL